MQIKLAGRVVLVTGAGRGIGRTLAESFADEDAIVVALDLPSPELETFGEPLEAAEGRRAHAVCDVRDSARVDAVAAAVAARFGRIDVLVNNAGVNAEGLIEEVSDDLWQRCLDINVGGVIRMSRAVIPYMKESGRGRIINAASFAAIVPTVGGGIYAASKAAVAQLTRSLAGELGPWDITVNAYAPGMVPSAMNGFADMPAERQDELLDTLTLRRWGTADEVADLVRFLASDAASYITGTLVDVSGGKLATQIPARAYSAVVG